MKNNLDLRIERMHNRFIGLRRAYKMDYLSNSKIHLDLRVYAANLSLRLTNAKVYAAVLNAKYDKELDSYTYDKWMECICEIADIEAELNNVIKQMLLYI